MTDKDIWTELGMLPPTELVKARLYAHHAVQWLARASRALGIPEDDDSHTALLWDYDLPGFRTQSIPGKVRKLQICLKFPNLSLIVRAADVPDVSIELEGHSDADIGSWLALQLLEHGRNPSAIFDDQPYEMPEHPVANRQKYKTAELKPALAELARWYSVANAVLSDLTDRYAVLQPGPSPVYCWPHHFDLAVLLTLEDGDPETAKSIGIGLSPGDDFYTQPYVYVNPWPHLEPVDLPPLDAPGQWHTDQFVGAVAPAVEILKLSDPYAGIWNFITTAIEVGHRRLVSPSVVKA